MNSLSINSEELESLRRLLSAATHEASAAMCCWTDGLITLTLDELREIPLESVAAELGLGEELLTMVVLSVPGEVGGEMILTFDEQNGRQLAAALLGRPANPQAEWSELEKSALTETGNILGCAYMNAISRLVNHRLMPSAPYFLQDYGASVLQQALLPQALTCDQVLICRTGFHREGMELNWNVLFVPSQKLRTIMGRALHIAANQPNPA